ncbi:DEAD/DEAH box helicase family protein [Xanthomonas campestris pv. campestris]|uniref:DEAD/DEAH box helicase n=1 Tax=Xanthomonas campestris TaxID=339 RepID=UPI001F356919|nr:DEAD/DEAH box helicase family protein [Xanthomonas campestris]MCF8808356.1 DEAD/DEAH box helicase family protein [Xanthomonas campestris pv. campestris]
MSSLNLAIAQSDALVPAVFQRSIIDNMASALLRQPSPPCLLRAPTGSGKTFMLASMLDRVSAAQPTLWLWFVPFVNLVQQTEDALLANAAGLTPAMLSRGRNQEPVAGMVLLSTAQAVAKAKDRKAGYAIDGDDDRKTLDEFVALARARGLKLGLVVDEAHIGLDHGTEFGQFAHWLNPDYLVMATATPKDARLDEFLAKAGKGAREVFVVSRDAVVEARLNKRYVEAVVYDLRHTISTVADLKRTVLRQAWLQHLWLKRQLQETGVELTPLLLVQVGNGEKTVEEAQRDLIQLCKVPPAAIGTHSADDPDPVLMAAIANDHTKEVLIFKQSAGTGFDAPRAFVLASTKAVNDADFAMQFIGRVMRVAPAIRKAFPKPMPIPPEFNTAYVYLADAEAQQGFQSAVNTAGAVKSQLEGQTEKMVARHTASGATVFSNRVTPQMPVTYESDPPDWRPSAQPDAPPVTGQSELFGDTPDAGVDTGTTLMSWDRVLPHSDSQPKAAILPANEQALVEVLSDQGLKAYRRNVQLRMAPSCMQQETRPILTDMARVSRKAADDLPLDDVLVASAVRATYNLLTEKEVHTELTEGSAHEKDVAIITNRGALLREAEASLRRIPQVEDEDVRIIVTTLAERLRPQVAAPPAKVGETARDEKQLARLSRDAACWVIRRQAQALAELVQETVAQFATVNDASPLPDAMLYPLQHALKQSRKNLYGVVPPLKDNIDSEREDLSIDAKASMAASALYFDGGKMLVGSFDGVSAVNSEEREFIHSLDRDDAVVWWHRNPDRKPWSVRLVRGEHGNYFYPDFVVCLEYPVGNAAMTRLVETKESTKDASRKARRVPKIYGKVMFVTKDNDKLRIVNDDGSLGVTFDWSDLNPAWNWMADSKAELSNSE